MWKQRSYFGHLPQGRGGKRNLAPTKTVCGKDFSHAKGGGAEEVLKLELEVLSILKGAQTVSIL